MTKVERSAFRHIMKGTAVFGGTQLLTMMANIVKGKFVAMILSDYGMGVSSLMQSALMPMQQLFSFGLPTAGVKDIAAETDPQRKAQMVLTFRRLLYSLAMLGSIVMAASASLFSISTFGDDSHTWWFVEMSVALLFFILATGENTILQGYRRLKSLATCNIMSALCGLLCSTPLYYFYGIEWMFRLTEKEFAFASLSFAERQISYLKSEMRIPEEEYRKMVEQLEKMKQENLKAQKKFEIDPFQENPEPEEEQNP